MEKNLGHATAYGYAKSKGYTGTEEEFGILMASYASVAQDASQSASSAAESAQLASSEAQKASQSATGAHNDAETASNIKTDVESARDTTVSAKNAAVEAKDISVEAKNSAISAKDTAESKAQIAEAWAVGQKDGTDVPSTDETYHNNAKYYSEQANTAKTDAETARNTAAQSASEAAASATSASGSAATASQAAQTATSKASEAVTAAETATTKASEANTSADTASAAATSASTSAQTATTAAATATTKASEASESATTATTAKTDAETARDAAEQSASEAAASAESIDPDEFDRKIYAAFATDTAIGAIANFPDGADNIPMKDVLVHIEPVQDLHGYDSPWPAGGGKNKLPYPFSDTTKTVAGITFTDLGDGKLKVNGTATARAVFFFASHAFKPIPSGDYILSRSAVVSDIVIAIDAYNGDTYVKNIMTAGVTERSFSIDYDGYDSIDIFIYVPAGQTVSNDIVSPIIRLATETDAAFSPYSNICPITGWTGAKVTRTGKNLLDTAIEDKTYRGVTYTHIEDGGISVIGTATNYTSYSPFFGGKILKAGTYGLSVTGLPSGTRVTIADEATQTTITSTSTSTSFTLTSDTLILCYIAVNKDIVVNTTAYVQLELGSTATAYEPYSGQTYSITFPSEAGTVYGGTLDVTSGVLTVDRAIIASYAGETLPSTWISDRDVYSAGATPTTGAQVCYPLATPITYTLTPQEITSLLGTNNLWADTGDSDVTYCVDPTLLSDNESSEIQSIKSMIAGVESSAVATKNYSIGDLVIVGDTLYKVTAAIASGETISVSNTVVTTVDDAIRNRIADSIDATLTQSGQAADAAAVGAIARVFLALGLRAGEDGRIIQRLPADG